MSGTHAGMTKGKRCDHVPYSYLPNASRLRERVCKMKKTVYTYTLYIKGVFGRNRSVKFHGFDVLEESDKPIGDAKAIAMAEKTFLAAKVKGRATVKLVECPQTLEQDGIFEVRSFGLGDSRTIFQWDVLP